MWSNPKLTALEDQALVPMLTEMGVRGHEREILDRLRPDYGELSFKTIVNAIATFERALISGRSPYDRLVFDADHKALSESAWRGMQVFFSERAGCAACHGGFNFSGPVRYVGGRAVRPSLVANGVTNGKFRVPTLRNVELTGPYMHDGSIATLDEVIARYVAAHKLDLTAVERADLAAFLRSLTDASFTTDPRFADPSPAPRERVARSDG
jgi:cytochrome c peroxidase